MRKFYISLSDQLIKMTQDIRNIEMCSEELVFDAQEKCSDERTIDQLQLQIEKERFTAKFAKKNDFLCVVNNRTDQLQKLNQRI